MYASLSIREIENGFVVGNDRNRNTLVGAEDGTGERYFATEAELRDAAGDILMGVLANAKVFMERSIEQQRAYAQQTANNRPDQSSGASELGWAA